METKKVKIEDIKLKYKNNYTIVDESMITFGKSPNGKIDLRLIKCNHCNEWFKSKKYSKTRRPKYCSSRCSGDSRKVNKKCKLCGSIIENKYSNSIKNRVYCGVECQSKARKGVKLSKEWRNAISIARKNSEKCKGENLYNWKGGKDTALIRAKQSHYKRKNNLRLPMPISYLDRLIEIQNWACFYCEKDLSNYKAIEHLTPVSMGGDNYEYNLVYSCKSCNSSKRQKTLEEYAISENRLDWLDKFDVIYASTIN